MLPSGRGRNNHAVILDKKEGSGRGRNQLGVQGESRPNLAHLNQREPRSDCLSGDFDFLYFTQGKYRFKIANNRPQASVWFGERTVMAVESCIPVIPSTPSR